jgi:hypothetical protein
LTAAAIHAGHLRNHGQEPFPPSLPPPSPPPTTGCFGPSPSSGVLAPPLPPPPPSLMAARNPTPTTAQSCSPCSPAPWPCPAPLCRSNNYVRKIGAGDHDADQERKKRRGVSGCLHSNSVSILIHTRVRLLLVPHRLRRTVHMGFIYIPTREVWAALKNHDKSKEPPVRALYSPLSSVPFRTNPIPLIRRRAAAARPSHPSSFRSGLLSKWKTQRVQNPIVEGRRLKGEGPLRSTPLAWQRRRL